MNKSWLIATMSIQFLYSVNVIWIVQLVLVVYTQAFDESIARPAQYWLLLTTTEPHSGIK